MNNSEVKITLLEEPVTMKSVTVGMSESEILFAVNCDENGTPEFACQFSAKMLKDIIMLLFKAGYEFQNVNNIDIGFPKSEDK